MRPLSRSALAALTTLAAVARSASAAAQPFPQDPPPGYEDPSGDAGPVAPGYGTPGYGAPGYGAPGYGAPGYGAPGYGAPGYGAPGYGAPGYGVPDDPPKTSRASIFALDLRTVAALGFFPLGGNLSIKENEFNTYVFGVGLDFFNIQSEHVRITILNISPYLVGFNWLALNGEDKSQFFSIALVHFGPHFRINALSLGKKNYAAIGVQPGYSFVLKSDTEKTSTRYMHGFDLAATLSWTPHDLVHVGSKSTKAMGVSGVLALAGAGALLGAIFAEGASNDLRMGLGIGGGATLLTASTIGVVVD